MYILHLQILLLMYFIGILTLIAETNKVVTCVTDTNLGGTMSGIACFSCLAHCVSTSRHTANTPLQLRVFICLRVLKHNDHYNELVRAVHNIVSISLASESDVPEFILVDP